MYSALVSLAARSRWTDESFKMCHFRDDPAPLNGTIRSAQLKYLLRENCSIFLNLYSVSVPIAKQFFTINEKWVLVKFMKALGTFCV